MSQPIYMDFAATTPVDPRVAAAMADCLTRGGKFGNPASRSHVFGWEAEEAVEQARVDVAALINADPREIVWTSGATEADNLAIKGVAEHYAERGRHIITSAIEHKAVLDTCAHLEALGWEVTYLTPGAGALVHSEQVAEAIRSDTVLVSIMHVNNEIGVVNDIAAIGAVCRERGVFFHTDAAQSAGKVAIDVASMPVDLISLCAHKIYGPKGIGALYVRRRPPVLVDAQIHGGGHERNMRSGTLATHQIVGMGESFRIAREDMADEVPRITGLRNRLWDGLANIEGSVLHGDPDARVCGIVNVGFPGVDGEALIMSLTDVALSSGSACTSASVEPSYVLRAIGVDDELAHASLRFSVGRFSTEAEVDLVIERVSEAVTRLREAHADTVDGLNHR